MCVLRWLLIPLSCVMIWTLVKGSRCIHENITEYHLTPREILVNWSAVEGNLCNTHLECYGAPSILNFIPQLCPLEAQPNDRVILVPPSNSLQALSAANVSEDQFLSCEGISEGQLFTPSPTNLPVLVPSSFLPAGQVAFFVQFPESVFATCKLGLRLRILVKTVSCQPDLSSEICSGRGQCITRWMEDEYYCRCYDNFTGKYCEEYDGCGIQPCHNGGTCLDLPLGHQREDYLCICSAFLTGPTCEEIEGNCNSSRCVNGECQAVSSSSHICLCQDGFQGVFCDDNINECLSAPCLNGATCEDSVAAFQCVCAEHFEGYNCGEMINYCDFSPCKNNGTCSPVFGGFNCTCVDGFTGDTCSINVDECSSHRCQNNGTCQDEIGMYSCVCQPGFEGLHCETDVDECTSSPCQQNSSCVDLVDGFHCECLPGWFGTLCELDIPECASSPCQNEGTCREELNGYSCECLQGLFSGPDCEVPLHNCSFYPCINNGTCSIVNQVTYSCDCVERYTGQNCETFIPYCVDNDCTNNSTCIEEESGYSCSCVVGYEGTLCQENIDDCKNHTCLNGAVCVDEVNSFQCQCLPGFTGVNCEFEINECDSFPCMNEATCVDAVNGFICHCLPGFDGTLCEVDVEECSSMPCLNEGTCKDVVSGYLCDCGIGFNGTNCAIDLDLCSLGVCGNSSLFCSEVQGGHNYSCVCSPGFTGYSCEVDIDECSSSPCQNEAICRDAVNAYQCYCLPGYVGDNCEFEINECFSSPCLHNSTCVDLFNNYTCLCAEGYEGFHCEIDIDDCESHRCHHGATCIDEVNGYRCQCTPAFTGELCEEDFDECLSNPCNSNTSMCVNLVDGYQCFCLSGWTGPTCTINIDECLSQPCLNGATCQDGVSSYTCQCTEGYRGTSCEEEINECDSKPCFHDGTCVDVLEGYVCICAAGYSGLNCEININECASTPCTNNGTCLDLINSFTCNCLPTYYGDDCSLLPCEVYPCENDGMCSNLRGDLENYPLGVRCDCLPGYLGLRCEINVDECPQDACSQNGFCLDGINSFTCLCGPGWAGFDCSQPIDDCIGNLCQNNSTCIDLNESYECLCPVGFEGDLCERETNECAMNYCRNGAQCVDLFNDYRCICQDGWMGKNCSLDVNECLSNPCLNNATCINQLNEFYCVCPPFITGPFCDTFFDPCDTEFNPCQNNATCISQQNGTSLCVCQEGFSGINCEINMNECASEPCLNGALCEDMIAGYTCHCVTGFMGRVCEENINDCSENVCRNNGTCVDEVNGYHCECTRGWTGPDCTIDIRECASRPCEHGATCVDLLDSYECICPLGYEGLDCETEINECLSEPCLNNATCIDLVGDVSCLCLDGFTGHLCEENLDDCEPFPCNNGSCVDQVAGFICECYPGYTGPTCQEDIDECASRPCLNDAACQNSIDGYFCLCQDGYRGINCEFDIDICNNTAYNSSQCLNGASCLDGPGNSFSCLCAPGFTGEYCQSDINECLSQPCQNGACLDEMNGFTCICMEGWTGDHCDTDLDECISQPCQNGAICSQQPPPGGYLCYCPPGYQGLNCEIDYNECLSTPCQNDATCIDGVNFYQCLCPFGFSGKECEAVVDVCTLEPCSNNATCIFTGPGTYNCSCDEGYFGTHCQDEDPCIASPCFNGGTCLSSGASFTCVCPTGFQGNLCETLSNITTTTADRLTTPEESFSTSSVIGTQGLTSRDRLTSQTEGPNFSSHGTSTARSKSTNRVSTTSQPLLSSRTTDREKSTSLTTSAVSAGILSTPDRLTPTTFQMSTLGMTPEMTSSLTEMSQTDSTSSVSHLPPITTPFASGITSDMIGRVTTFTSSNAGSSSQESLAPEDGTTDTMITSLDKTSFAELSTGGPDLLTTSPLDITTSDRIQQSTPSVDRKVTYLSSFTSVVSAVSTVSPKEETVAATSMSEMTDSLSTPLHPEITLEPSGPGMGTMETFSSPLGVSSTPYVSVSSSEADITDHQTDSVSFVSTSTTVMTSSADTRETSAEFGTKVTEKLASSPGFVPSSSAATERVTSRDLTSEEIPLKTSTEKISESRTVKTEPVTSTPTTILAETSLAETSENFLYTAKITSSFPGRGGSTPDEIKTVDVITDTVQSSPVTLEGSLETASRKGTQLTEMATSISSMGSSEEAKTVGEFSTETFSQSFTTNTAKTTDRFEVALTSESVSEVTPDATKASSSSSRGIETSVPSVGVTIDQSGPDFLGTTEISGFTQSQMISSDKVETQSVGTVKLSSSTVSPEGPSLTSTRILTPGSLSTEVALSTSVKKTGSPAGTEMQKTSSLGTERKTLTEIDSTLEIQETSDLSTADGTVSVLTTERGLSTSPGEVTFPLSISTMAHGVTESHSTIGRQSSTESPFTSGRKLSTLEYSSPIITTDSASTTTVGTMTMQATSSTSGKLSTLTSTHATSIDTTTPDKMVPSTQPTGGEQSTTVTTGGETTRSLISEMVATSQMSETSDQSDSSLPSKTLSSTVTDSVSSTMSADVTSLPFASESSDSTFSTVVTSPSLNPATCQTVPCQNGGVCKEETSTGLISYQCNCPFRFGGNFCEYELTIFFPSFRGDSFLQHDLLGFAGLPSNDIFIQFIPQSSSGLLLFSEAIPISSTDYLHLYLRDWRVIVEISCGFGQILRVESDVVITADEQVGVFVRQRRPSGFQFTCGLDLEVKGQTTSTQAFSFIYPQPLGSLYVGGLPSDFTPQTTPPPVSGFVGCIHFLQVNSVEYFVYQDAVNGKNIGSCQVADLCMFNPCRNNATCSSASSNASFSCQCLDGYSGILCEHETHFCWPNPCHAGATCVSLEDQQTFACLCPYGRFGLTCNESLAISRPLFSGTNLGYSSHLQYARVLNWDFVMTLKLKFALANSNSAVKSNWLLFSGQKGEGYRGSDYLALGIEDGYLKLLFDLGTGAAVLRSPEPLNLSLAFHDLLLGRHEKEGWLKVDDQVNVSATTQGHLIGLNTYRDLFIGGVHPGEQLYLPDNLSFKNGFEGCVYDLEVKAGQYGGFSKVGDPPGHVDSAINVGQCELSECALSECKNGAICVDLGASYRCECLPGWKGPLCEDKINACDPQHEPPPSCSAGSLCLLQPVGYTCLCPLGKTGRFCSIDQSISDPRFHGDWSFMSFEPFRDIRYETLITIEFKATSQSGLLFYAAQSLQEDAGDFISVALTNGFIEFRFSLDGQSDPAIIKSSTPLDMTSDTWLSLEVSRFNQLGLLRFEGEEIRRRAPGSLTSLDIGTDLYAGGVPDLSAINPLAVENEPSGFEGCIRRIVVNGYELDLTIDGAKDGRNVGDCDGTGCGYGVCKNNGTCLVGLLDPMDFICQCQTPYTGRTCTESTFCLNNLCENEGLCVSDHDSATYNCSCQLGWAGPYCNLSVIISTSVHLTPKSSILYSDESYNNSNTTITNISLSFKTRHPSGMILWAGEPVTGGGRDYLGLGLEDGKVKLGIHLGYDSSTLIKHGTSLNDGNWHTITIHRFEGDLSLHVDNQSLLSLNVGGSYTSLDIRGLYYFGGFGAGTDVAISTGGVFDNTLDHCVSDVTIGDNKGPIDFSESSFAYDITSCT
ncbi:Protein eyes shut-like [Holothuria leucospilota]|uniref:Protein eyes shut-like n=1 Tax=Holothuria leucospilota TaxID=206669 RepID=A0A9Q1BCQ9_HOLLE|nr:Protein eyes shut-like [Holothuria leucospilota]